MLEFELQPSRYALYAPLNGLGCILVLLYITVKPLCFFILAVSLLLSFWFFWKTKRQIIAIAEFEKNIWTVVYSDCKKEKFNITYTVNHRLYIIFHTTSHNVIIWQDQLSKKDWKKLVLFTKLYPHFKE
ncbi:hypothetical protein [Acinetobacter sp. HY1485]|uniref:hypothetical protein n=1 Tax=Acinetobacter sp. HY1485 TaxID=2970918 RepID=UPI0022B9B82D|nr:hypothetical protein [Acinetobacter sp. HY1485]